MRSVCMLVSPLVGLVALFGCATQTKPEPPPPSLTELPRFDELQQTIPAKILVEGRSSRAADRRLTPDFKEPPLTEKERKALGIPDDRQLLAFYEKPRGPEHGVSTQESRIDTVISGKAGGLAMRSSHLEPWLAVHGETAKYDSYLLAARVAAMSPLPSTIYGYGPAVYVITAIDRERRVADHHSRVGQ